MTLAIFDLDNTLLSGDSDHGWGNFLVQKKLVEEEIYQRANEKFFTMYNQGTLDIYEYSAFSFKPLAERSMEDLRKLHEEFMRDIIQPMIGTKAKALVEFHREQGHTLLVITATNSFVTRPIVEAFGIQNLLATDPRIINGRYTTQIEGTPCFHEGKVLRLKEWLKKKNMGLAGSYFYSDSHNDLPLMELVETAIAVDPDDTLAEIARRRGWKVISLLD